MSTPRQYPLPPPVEVEARFAAVALEWAAVLTRYDFPPLTSVDLAELQQSLLAFLYGGEPRP